jgi:hypothetical protein
VVLLFLALLQAIPPLDGDDIVVIARRGKCTVRIADRIISDREFKARAGEWAAGRPVRITVPAGSSYKCMARIMFRLGHYGVTKAVFLDR